VALAIDSGSAPTWPAVTILGCKVVVDFVDTANGCWDNNLVGRRRSRRPSDSQIRANRVRSLDIKSAAGPAVDQVQALVSFRFGDGRKSHKFVW